MKINVNLSLCSALRWRPRAVKVMGETAELEDGTVTRSAEYVGSFPVEDCCLDEQIQFLTLQLQTLRTCPRHRAVSLKFSIKGVKMYDEDEATLLMAHALRRISLCTAYPYDEQFAFVSHNPGSLNSQLYCHLYKAHHPRAAQFLNLLLVRCFQLSYLQKHPEEVEEEMLSPMLTPVPPLLNQGFPLSVSALVSFRRAPMLGLLSKDKAITTTCEEQLSSSEEGPASSPTLVRKKAIRNKVLRSGAYRSFTYTPHRQRNVQDKLNCVHGKRHERLNVPKPQPRSLAETEEALAEAVWSWAGICSDSVSTLLEEDVLGSFLLTNSGSVIVRCPSGVVTYSISKTPTGKYAMENCRKEFDTIADLIEHYHEFAGELECLLSTTRVNHCYEWEESVGKASSVRPGPGRCGHTTLHK